MSVVLEASQKVPDTSILAPLTTMKVRKVLKRQRVKIMQFDWSADNHHVITGGQVRFCQSSKPHPPLSLCFCFCFFGHYQLQDGMLCVWDAFTEQKVSLVQFVASSGAR